MVRFIYINFNFKEIKGVDNYVEGGGIGLYTPQSLGQCTAPSYPGSLPTPGAMEKTLVGAGHVTL